MAAQRRFTRADRACIEEIQRALSDIDERGRPAVFDQLMPGVRSLLRMEQSALFFFERSDETVGVDRIHIDGSVLPAPEVRAIADAHFRRSRVWALYDPKNPEAEQQNRPMVVGGTLDALAERGSPAAGRAGVSSRLGIDERELEHRLEAFEQTERALLAPIGWAGRKQLRALLCDGGALVGWLGGTAEEFGAREELLLARLVPSFLARIQLEKRLQQGALAAVGLAAALEAITSPAFVVSSKGIVEHANTLGHGALAADGEIATKLRDCASGSAPTGDVELAYLSAPGMQTHVLVILRSLASDVERKVQVATSRWGLTPREAKVLQELTVGAANKDIAGRLGCSERTVEVHVTSVFAKSGCSSRLALIAHLWRMR
jgi:DNA-binding CsgD family transcriptional regulator